MKPRKDVAHSDDNELERDVAMADRSAAVDGAVKAVSWLIGTALLLNGGALLAVIGQENLPTTIALFAPFIFLSGLFSAAFAAGLSAHFAVRVFDMANIRLKRLPADRLLWTARWQALFAVLIGLALVSSYASFGIGATKALEETALARLDAQAKELKAQASNAAASAE